MCWGSGLTAVRQPAHRSGGILESVPGTILLLREITCTQVCYDGRRLLEQFAYPFKQDGEDVERAYPWVAGWDGGCAASGR